MDPNAIISRMMMAKTSFFFCTLSIVQVWTGDVGVHNKSIKMYSVFPDPRLSYDGYHWGAFFVFLRVMKEICLTL